MKFFSSSWGIFLYDDSTLDRYLSRKVNGKTLLAFWQETDIAKQHNQSDSFNV